jgi:hypothetical protein
MEDTYLCLKQNIKKKRVLINIIMKRLLLLFLLIMGMSCAFSQNAQEVVYLKNGSIIHGTILEEVPNQSVKIKTSDGNVFVYKMSEIEKISREEKKEVQNNEISDKYYSKWAFEVNGGFIFGIGKSSGTTGLADVGLYKRVNKNLALGMNLGAEIPTSSGGKIAIPASLNTRFLFPLRSTNLIPFANLGFGYTYNTAGKKTTKVGSKKITVDNPDWIELQVIPGLILPISNGCSLRAGFGYIHSFLTKGGGGSDALAIKLGFDFYKNSTVRIHHKRQKPPVREEGLQLTFEGGCADPNDIGKDAHPYCGPSFSLACTYKFDENISLGAGIGYDFINGAYGYKNHNYNEGFDSDLEGYRLFARGNYRLTNKPFSLLGTCDAGIRYHTCSEQGDENANKNNGIGLYLSPAAGFSLRILSNSYFEMKFGYTLCTKTMKDHSSYPSTTKSYGTSAMFVSLGFTHTFDWMSRKF